MLILGRFKNIIPQFVWCKAFTGEKSEWRFDENDNAIRHQ